MATCRKSTIPSPRQVTSKAIRGGKRPVARVEDGVKNKKDPVNNSKSNRLVSKTPRCQRCRKMKKGCDRRRPCGRCKDAGIGIEGCADAQVKVKDEEVDGEKDVDMFEDNNARRRAPRGIPNVRKSLPVSRNEWTVDIPGNNRATRALYEEYNRELCELRARPKSLSEYEKNPISHDGNDGLVLKTRRIPEFGTHSQEIRDSRGQIIPKGLRESASRLSASVKAEVDDNNDFVKVEDSDSEDHVNVSRSSRKKSNGKAAKSRIDKED
jgi:hypothetical protein